MAVEATATRGSPQNGNTNSNGIDETQFKKSNPLEKCTSPEEIFAIATALTVLLSKELNQKQMSTMINFLALLLANLSAVLTQIQICEGVEIQPPI